jgi:hypothetical protein
MLHNVGTIAIDPSTIESALSAAILHAQRVRADHRGPIQPDGIIDAYTRHRDSVALQHMASEGWRADAAMLQEARRSDALNVAGAFPRDLEYVRRQVLEEPLPELNSFRLFPADNEVPLGYTSHVMERWLTAGEAQITRGGSSVPVVSSAKREERFPVHYVVCGVTQNFFQGLSIRAADLRTYQINSRTALQAVNERLNRIYWGGDFATQLKGVLNYPHMHVSTLPLVFDPATSGPAMAAALSRVVGTPRIVSKQTIWPNRLVVSETVHQLIHDTQYTAGQTTTVAEYFLKGQVGKPNGIKVIEAAYELEADSDEMKSAGAPPGYHGIFAFRGDTGAIRRVVVQEPTWLPAFQNGPFDNLHVIFAATGGVVEPITGAHSLTFVRVP